MSSARMQPKPPFWAKVVIVTKSQNPMGGPGSGLRGCIETNVICENAAKAYCCSHERKLLDNEALAREGAPSPMSSARMQPKPPFWRRPSTQSNMNWTPSLW